MKRGFEKRRMNLTTGKLFRVIAVHTIFASVSFAVFAQTQRPATKSRPSESAVKMQPLNIKPGLWESTRTISRAGQMPIPAATLNRLSPEQRARVEARMKANAASHSRTTTEKQCVTREQIEDQKLDLDGEQACTTTITNSTSTMAKGNVSCNTQGMQGHGTFEIESSDPEHYKGSAHSTLTGSGQSMNVDVAFTSKWLGSRCEDAK